MISIKPNGKGKTKKESRGGYEIAGGYGKGKIMIDEVASSLMGCL
jgi:hypothetical protein